MRLSVRNKLEKQLEETFKDLEPTNTVYKGLKSFHKLLVLYFSYLQGDYMDKKMHQVTKKMEVAAKDISKGKPKEAKKVLKKAEKKNEKLVKIDKNVRDPMIKKCKKIISKGRGQ